MHIYDRIAGVLLCDGVVMVDDILEEALDVE